MSYAYEPKEKKCKRCGATALEVLILERIKNKCLKDSTYVCHRNAPHDECSSFWDMDLACEACFVDVDFKKYWVTGYDHDRLAKLIVERKLVDTLEKAKHYLHTGEWQFV